MKTIRTKALAALAMTTVLSVILIPSSFAQSIFEERRGVLVRLVNECKDATDVDSCVQSTLDTIREELRAKRDAVRSAIDECGKPQDATDTDAYQACLVENGVDADTAAKVTEQKTKGRKMGHEKGEGLGEEVRAELEAAGCTLPEPPEPGAASDLSDDEKEARRAEHEAAREELEACAEAAGIDLPEQHDDREGPQGPRGDDGPRLSADDKDAIEASGCVRPERPTREEFENLSDDEKEALKESHQAEAEEFRTCIEENTSIELPEHTQPRRPERGPRGRFGPEEDDDDDE